MESVASQGCQRPSSSSCRCSTLFLNSLSLAELQLIVGPQESWALEAVAIGATRNSNKHIARTLFSRTCSVALSDLTKHSFKDKIIKNGDNRVLGQAGGLLSRGAGWLHSSRAHGAGMFHQVWKDMNSFYLFAPLRSVWGFCPQGQFTI